MALAKQRSQPNESSPEQISEQRYRVIHPSPLDLRQWLDVSWFFPEEFNKESIAEDAHNLYVAGAREVYRFEKSSAYLFQEQPNLEVRWQHALQEIADNEPLAPGYYLGIRPLRWVEGEPEWLSDEPILDLISGTPPLEANDFAVVVRRTQLDMRMDEYLRAHEELQNSQHASLATVLSDFHRRASYRSKRLLLNDTRFIGRHLRAVHLDRLRDEVSNVLPHLDRLQALAFLEMQRFVVSYFQHHEDDFLARGQQGLVADIHSDLKIEHVYFQRFHSKLPKALILGRPRETNRDRLHDVLQDVASLAVELETHDHQRESEKFVEAYRQRNTDAFREDILTFLKVSTLIRKILDSGQSTAAHLPRFQEEVEQSIQVGLRHARGLKRSTMLIFQSSSKNSSENTAQTTTEERVCLHLSRLLGAPVVEIPAVQHPNTAVNFFLCDRFLPALLQIALRHGLVLRTQLPRVALEHFVREAREELGKDIFVLRLKEPAQVLKERRVSNADTKSGLSDELSVRCSPTDPPVIDIETSLDEIDLAFHILTYLNFSQAH